MPGPTQLFDAGAPDVVYLVDLSGYVFRAYHAVAPLTSPTGEPTHAVVGTVNMLDLLVRERDPRMMAVAMDAGRDTFRREIYPEYKANRPPTPDDLKSQMGRVQQIVEAFAIPVFRERGVEADDLIATAVRQARERDLRVVIVSGDKDLMQLIGANVVMWDTMRNKVFGPPEAEERFGVRVGQLRDLLALMGDSSDNVPGVPSVGPKTARDLLGQFGSLEGVYENIGSIRRKKLREALEIHRDQAFLSRRLVTLKEDCNLVLDLESLAYRGRDVGALRRLYSELGFRRQLAALEAAHAEPPAGARPTPSAEQPPTPDVIVERSALEALVAETRRTGRVALDVVASSAEPMRADLVGIALHTRSGAGSYVPLCHRYVGAPRQLPLDEVRETLAPVLADERVAKGCHDAKSTAVLLHRHGMPLRGVTFDPMIASYLLEPTGAHTLPAVARGELGRRLRTPDELTDKRRGHRLQVDEVAVGEAAAFAAGNAGAVADLWDRVVARLEDTGLGPLFADVEMALSGVLADMERTGVLVDAALLAGLGERMAKDLARLEAEAHRIAGKPFNVSSPRQLETILFDEIGLRPIKRTKTARSTDAATLEALAAEHELPRVILEHRQIAKLKGTYVDALPALIHPDTGRIHTKWEQAVAATGRLSSSDPNLQNIPVRTERGRQIRSAFVAPEGRVLLSADYSQIELRVLAHLSGDPVLAEAFHSGQDVHQRTAMEIFDKPAGEVSRELRTRAKAVNFGVVYGQGDVGLAKSLGIARAEASSFIAAYFRRYRGVRRFMDDTLVRARAGEAVTTLLGRRRTIQDIRSSHRAKRLAAERIAMNTPIQGSAADLLKLAMLALRDPVVEGARMILTVHDELVFEVPSGSAERAARLVKEAMEGVYDLDVPLVVDVGWGPTWTSAH